MATTSRRTAFIRELFRRMRDDTVLGGIGLTEGWPGDELEPEHVWLDDLDGEENFPVSMAGRVLRDDIFDVVLVCRSATEGADRLDAMDRCESYLNAIGSIVVASNMHGAIDGLVDVVTGDKRGPKSYPGPAGAEAFGRYVLNVHTRIS